MARTLATMVTNCISRSDIRSLQSSDWYVWINEGRIHLRDRLVAANMGYFVSTDTTKTTVVGQEDYALPDTFLRLLGVDLEDEQGDWQALHPYRHGDRNVLRNADILEELKYALNGSNLSLLPAPNVAGRTIRITYVPVPTALTAGTDSISGIEEYFADYIEIYAALQARIRVEEDTLPLERMLTRAKERIAKASTHRDSNHPAVLGSMVPWQIGRNGRRGW